MKILAISNQIFLITSDTCRKACSKTRTRSQRRPQLLELALSELGWRRRREGLLHWSNWWGLPILRTSWRRKARADEADNRWRGERDLLEGQCSLPRSEGLHQEELVRRRVAPPQVGRSHLHEAESHQLHELSNNNVLNKLQSMVDWQNISRLVPGRNDNQCHYKWQSEYKQEAQK